MRSLALILCALSFAVTEVSAAEYLVTDVVLVDPVRRELRPAEIGVVDGRISGVFEPGEADLPAEVERWSAEGRFALPAMLDASTFSSTQVSPGHRDTLGRRCERSGQHSIGHDAHHNGTVPNLIEKNLGLLDDPPSVINNDLPCFSEKVVTTDRQNAAAFFPRSVSWCLS